MNNGALIEGIKKIEIIKKDGKFHIHVIKEKCNKSEEITADVLKSISNTLNNNTRRIIKFPNLFGNHDLFEQSLEQKHAYRA